jgi:hypothetical protein
VKEFWQAECRVPAAADVHVRRVDGDLFIAERVANCHEKYDPWADTEPLWDAVAELAERPHPDACVSFVERWGLLLRGYDLIQEDRAAQDHRTWTYHLANFRLGVEVRRGLSLAKWSRFERFDIEEAGDRKGGYLVYAKLQNQVGELPYVARTSHPTHKAKAARALLQNYADIALASETYIRVPLEGDGVEAVAASPLAAAWVQLLEEPAGRPGVECEWCGKWTTYKPGNPNRKRFCRDYCRVQWNRASKRRS